MKYLYAVLALFCLHSSFAQFQPVYTNFTEESGLTSNECYTIFQSSSGDIWIGTDNGLSRYNGVEFKNYTYRDGLGSNAVFQIHEDDHGRVWFLTDLFEISYFEDDIIKPYEYNHLLSEYGPKKVEPLSFYVKDNAVLIGTNRLGAIYINSSGKKTHFFKGNSTLLFRTETGCVYATCNSPNNISKDNDSVIECVRLYSKGLDSFSEYAIKTEKTDHLFTRSIRIKDEYFFNLNSILVHLNARSEKIEIIPMEGIVSIGDVAGRIILGSLSGKNKTYDPVRKLITELPYFDEKKISKTLIDNNNGIWIATLNNGVFYHPKSSLEYSSRFSGQIISALESHRDSLLVSTINNGCYLFLNETPQKIEGNWNVTKPVIARFFADSKTTFNSLSLENITTIKKVIHSFGKLVVLDNHQQIFIDGVNVNELDAKGIVDITNVKNEIYAISQTGKIYKIDGSSVVQVFHDNKLQFNKVESFRKGLIIGTRNEGILYYQDGRLKQFEFNSNNGISVRSIKVITDTSFVYGTEKGLHYLCFSDDRKTWLNYNLNTSNGLKSNLIRFVEVLNDTIYFTTTDLVYRFPIKGFNREFGKLFIRRLSFNDEDGGEQDLTNYTIDYNNKDFKLFVWTNNFLPTKIFIRYRLSVGGDVSEWNVISSNEIHLPNLQPGSYSLEVCASSNGKNFGQINTVHFEKLPPWYLTSKAIVVFTLLILGSVLVIIFLITRSKKRKAEKNLIIKKIQLNSLNNQLNPHFLFNTLGSIQTLVMKNEKKQAISYLAQFASFLRSNLNSFESEAITLSKEIELITTYLELEKLRFKEKLKYDIVIEKGVEKMNTHVLPFISQPLIENAIIHGISSLDYQGEITISFSSDDTYLIIEIEDNGVGMLPELVSESNSKGIDIVRQRLSTWSKNSSLEYIQQERGTLAKIKMTK